MFTLPANCIKILGFDGQTTKLKNFFENMNIANLSDHWARNTKKCFVKLMRTQWNTLSCYIILVEVTICQTLEPHSKSQVGNLMSREKRLIEFGSI